MSKCHSKKGHLHWVLLRHFCSSSSTCFKSNLVQSCTNGNCKILAVVNKKEPFIYEKILPAERMRGWSFIRNFCKYNMNWPVVTCDKHCLLTFSNLRSSQPFDFDVTYLFKIQIPTNSAIGPSWVGLSDCPKLTFSNGLSCSSFMLCLLLKHKIELL